MEKRYFVTIIAPDTHRLKQLAQFDLDVFPGNSPRITDERLSTGGLLSLEAIGRLVDAGYQVLVEAEASTRAFGNKEIVTLDQWLKAMLADLEGQEE
jgi:hypothetical protein